MTAATLNMMNPDDKWMFGSGDPTVISFYHLPGRPCLQHEHTINLPVL
jgi:hypothetical protein